MYGIKSRRLRSQILNFLSFQFYFKRKSGFRKIWLQASGKSEGDNPSEKIVIVKEELHGIDIET